MEFVINHYLVARSCRGMCGTKLKNGRVLVLCRVVSCRMLSCRVVSHMCELKLSSHMCDTTRQSCRMLSCRVVSHMCELKLSSHMCDTTRQHATRQERESRHDDFLVWCHTYHDTTMRLDTIYYKLHDNLVV